ncbi:MAG: MarR family transcriptional regulator [Cyclobacteriaceae bacterium]|nr:MarR family transcriptional regulator [Cyclobacteriaceae bacterium HetDA_MAG_MS6]
MKLELPVEIEFVKRLTEVHWAFQTKANNVLHKFGVTAEQVKMLSIIKSSPGCDQKFLAEQTKKVKSAVTQMVRKMGEEGLVARTTSSEDARTNQIYITEKGESLLKKGSEELVMTMRKIMDNDTAELKKMVTILDDISKKIVNK